MGDLFWLILGPVVVAYVGWRVRSYLADRARYRAEEQRDREWDAAHEIGDAEATARAAGWIPLDEVLDALRDHDKVWIWAGQFGPSRNACYVSSSDRERLVLYLADRFRPDALPSTDTKEATHG